MRDVPIDFGRPGARMRIVGLLALAGLSCMLTTPVSRAESAIEILSDEDSSGRSGGWLGVHIQDLDASLAEVLDLDRSKGALVSDVMDDSPADDAGLRAQDVILAVGRDAVVDARQLTHLLREHQSGDEVYLTVWRDGEQLDLRVELGDAPAHPMRPEPRGPAFRFYAPPPPDTLTAAPPEPPKLNAPGRVRVRFRAEQPRLGVTVLSPNESLAGYFEVRPGQGVLVTGVQGGSAAEAAGLEAGDVILSVDDREIGSPEELREAIRKRAGDALRIEILRGGRPERVVAHLAPERTMRKPRDVDPAEILKRDWRRLRRDLQRHAPEVARRELRNLKLEIDELRKELEELRDEIREEIEER